MNQDKHNQLRQILIDSGAPEIGNAIIDEICGLFNFPDTNQFTLPAVKEVGSEGAARELAIDWQRWASDQELSLDELPEFQNFFEEVAKKFNLTEEFKENAII